MSFAFHLTLLLIWTWYVYLLTISPLVLAWMFRCREYILLDITQFILSVCFPLSLHHKCSGCNILPKPLVYLCRSWTCFLFRVTGIVNTSLVAAATVWILLFCSCMLLFFCIGLVPLAVLYVFFEQLWNCIWKFVDELSVTEKYKLMFLFGLFTLEFTQYSEFWRND
jgi:hypothetical protein